MPPKKPAPKTAKVIKTGTNIFGEQFTKLSKLPKQGMAAGNPFNEVARAQKFKPPLTADESRVIKNSSKRAVRLSRAAKERFGGAFTPEGEKFMRSSGGFASARQAMKTKSANLKAGMEKMKEAEGRLNAAADKLKAAKAAPKPAPKPAAKPAPKPMNGGRSMGGGGGGGGAGGMGPGRGMAPKKQP